MLASDIFRISPIISNLPKEYRMSYKLATMPKALRL